MLAVVTIKNLKFAPLPTGLHVGDTIEWVNDDMFLHSATAADKSFDVVVMSEVIEHLLRAGTEMLLAFRGVIDARADEMDPTGGDEPGPTRLEKIDIG